MCRACWSFGTAFTVQFVEPFSVIVRCHAYGASPDRPAIQRKLTNVSKWTPDCEFKSKSESVQKIATLSNISSNIEVDSVKVRKSSSTSELGRLRDVTALRPLRGGPRAHTVPFLYDNSANLSWPVSNSGELYIARPSSRIRNIRRRITKRLKWIRSKGEWRSRSTGR
jgi:hypothetical protein